MWRGSMPRSCWGARRLGGIKFRITDAAGAKWAVARDPRAILSRAPVRLIPVTLKPGQSFAIPAVTFEIRNQPKVTELPGALPKAKIITAARVFFKARLGQFQAANRGKAFCDELAANQFAPRITEAGRHWSARFDMEIESKVGKQVMGMIILLDVKGKGVNPNPAFGFYPDKDAERPRMQINLPVRARRSKPLVPRR